MYKAYYQQKVSERGKIIFKEEKNRLRKHTYNEKRPTILIYLFGTDAYYFCYKLF